MELCEHIACTGCGACLNICPLNAITMVPDCEGFLRPAIDEKKCVHCGKCKDICPQNAVKEQNNDRKKVYACWAKSQLLRKNSTSGGAFTALAEGILAEGGVIFGAGFDSSLRVIHLPVEKNRELEVLRGSKYVQSDVQLTFREVKDYLQLGRKVLYSGTPCQIDGLYAYLGKKYPGQLYTIDLVCHGVPSPKVFRDYLDYMEATHQAKIQQVFFRNKEPGWYVFGMKLIFDQGEAYKATTYDDPYIRGFLREYFLRPSCHQCRYAGIQRVADITLADFWGYQETCRADRDHDKGISMVMINSEYGEELFECVRSKLRVWERPLEQAVNGNQSLRTYWQANPNRDLFWQDYNANSFSGIIDKYLFPEKNGFFPNRRKQHLQEDLYWLRYLPNRLARRIFGDNTIDKIKRRFGKL